jgi:flagellar motor switch protein FliM
MSDILSQDEVQALLKGIAEGRVSGAGADAAARGAVQAIDLTNQERVLRSVPGLELVVERFARALRGSLAAFFGQLPAVAVGTLEQVRFGRVLERLAPPASLQLFKLTPLRGTGMLVVTPPLVGALVQTFFGGSPGRGGAAPARELSAIELRVVERLGARVLQDLRAAWEPIAPVACTFLRSETNARFASIVPADDVVLLLELTVAVEGVADGGLAVCIPNAALDPIRARLQQAAVGERDAQDGSWRDRLRAALAATEVEVSVELGSRRLPLRAVLGLHAGEVVPVGTGREGPVVVRVAGRPRFVGAPGVAGGHNAVRITATI